MTRDFSPLIKRVLAGVALLRVFMNIFIKIEIQRPKIFNFKAFGMINLDYEIRIFQKIYYSVTMTFSVKFVV